MPHDVFISYSSKDKTVADAVCGTLENRDIRCWIAPRDIPPGESWVAAIINAIGNSRVFVLIFSEGSNRSGQVLREVGEAVDNAIPIIPFRIEDVELSDEMRYFIKSIHWLDAMTPPLESHLTRLADLVESSLTYKTVSEPARTTSVVRSPVKKTWPVPIWATVLIAGSGIILLGWIAFSMNSRFGTTTSSSVSTITPTAAERTETATLQASPSPSTSEWRTLTFNITNDILWTKTPDGKYTIIGSEDTFAWSDEVIEGDFILKADVESKFDYFGEGMIIVYGDGISWSRGCLIFNITGYWQAIRAHSIYDPEVEWLVMNEMLLDFEERTKFNMTIEVVNDIANLYVDGDKVASTSLPPEINRRGMIGLVKYQGSEDVTFSNILFKPIEDNR
ncbi:MAG: TIR domain-containing protein [Anaerolineales bacterium]|nr:TIR domain-containing protein [Anaerolineales bacterium]